MHFIEILFILMLNAVLLLVMHRFQNYSLDRKIKLLKNEIQELEDLVTAIIEEFEDVVTTTDTDSTDEHPLRLEEQASSVEPARPSMEAAPETLNVKNTSVDPRHQPIIELSRRGLTVEEIAKELKIGRGEVSLVLEVYQRS